MEFWLIGQLAEGMINRNLGGISTKRHFPTDKQLAEQPVEIMLTGGWPIDIIIILDKLYPLNLIFGICSISTKSWRKQFCG